MFADSDRSDGTRDAPSLTRLVTQFLDKLSSVMTHAPLPWFVRCGKWRRVGGIAGSPLRLGNSSRQKAMREIGVERVGLISSALSDTPSSISAVCSQNVATVDFSRSSRSCILTSR